MILLNPQGELVEVPDEQGPSALRLGYAQASPEQLAQAQALKERHAKYGTLGQQIATGAESAASALTFGASPIVEQALGVPKEDILARRQENPVASGIGTGVGIMAPVALTLGAGAPAAGAAAAGEAAAATGARAVLGKAAQYTAPGAIAKLGQATTRLAEGALPASSAAGKIASHAAAVGLGSAVENSAFVLGQKVDEAALGDPNLAAQSLIADVGLGAVLGGGIGVLGGAVSGAVRESLGANPGAKLRTWLAETEGNRNIKAAGAIQGDVTRTRRQIGRTRLNELGQEMGELGLVGPLTTPSQTYERAHDLMSVAGKEMKGLLRQADEAAPTSAPKIGEVLGRVRAETLAPLEANPLEQGAAEQLRGFLDGYEAKYAGGMTFSDLHQIRREISDKLYGLRGNQDPFANKLKDALHDFRVAVSDELNAGMDRAGVSSDAWKKVNRRYEVAARAAEFADKGMDRGHGNNLFSLTEIIGAVAGGVGAGPVGALATGAGTALARRHGSGVIGWAARGLRRALDGSTALAETVGDDAVAAANVARPALAESTPIRVVTPQRPTGEPARYAVVEADDIIASHTPRGFQPNPAYPAGVQEREYHRSPVEQQKVVMGAQKLNPALVLADTPTAVDGPPIVTAGRPIVLGGNGRTLMLQRAYMADDAASAAYRLALESKAPALGIPAETVAGMKQPVLVRVLEGTSSGSPQPELAAAVRRFNEGLTAELSPVARAVSQARLLSDESVSDIGQILGGAEEKSLRDLMRERPDDFVTFLTRDGVITPATRAKYVAGGQLTDAAKDEIEGMFLGRVVGSGERLSAVPPAVQRKLERVAPHLMRVSAVNPTVEEIGTVQAALDLMAEANRRGMTLDQLLAQGSMFEAVTTDPAAVAMAKLVDRSTGKDLAARFRAWADQASFDPRQATMFQQPPSAAELRRTLYKGVVADDDPMAGWGRGTSDAPAPPPVETEPPASNPPEKVEALATVERTQAKVARRIDRGVSQAVRGLSGGAGSGAIVGLTRAFQVNREDQEKRFAKQSAQALTLADPEILHEKLARATDGLHDHAPNTAQALTITGARAASFLASKLPKPPPGGPLSSDWTPSRAEIAKWNRYREAVEDPLSILKQAAAGTLTPEAIEAVATVYPELMEQIRLSVVDKLSSGRGSVPYRQRLMVGMILGSDMDGTMGLVGRSQQAFAAPSKRQDATPSAKGQAKLTLGNRLLTPMQSAARR